MFEVLHSPWSPVSLHGRGCSRTSPLTRVRPARTIACTAKVYIAATHLEGMERVESLLEALGRGFQDVVALHTMTIIEQAVEGDASLKV